MKQDSTVLAAARTAGSPTVCKGPKTLKRYVNNDDRAWKDIPNSRLKDVGGKFLLRWNFDVSKLLINVPAFYKECLHSWSSLDKWTNEITDGVLQQPIRNNKFV